MSEGGLEGRTNRLTSYRDRKRKKHDERKKKDNPSLK